ncbi:hypothetical protein [Thermococcus sp.]|uniref:hypothetical protein n=1 Tax=Thermococcus sp. TaxID=35749 RepID=UPI0026021A96|nr:hypothetical protein [Thermococcus sp.]
MRRIIAIIVALLLLTPVFGVASAASSDNSQRFFDVNFFIRVQQVPLNGTPVWLATFSIYAHLKDPTFRAYFNGLAAQNRTKADEEFRNFVRQLIYDNLKEDFNKRLEGTNLTSIISPPQIRLLGNWSAQVNFALTNFLVSTDGKFLRCPFSGHLNFVFQGHVYDYRWNRMTIVLPSGYELYELAPKPEDYSKNVAIWENGTYIPLIEFYTPIYTFMRYINSTKRSISLSYDPAQGYVQFNATFYRLPKYPTTVDYLVRSFRQSMEIISIDTLEKNGTLVVVGVARPKVVHYTKNGKEIWQALLKLPGRFDNVTVTTGTYQIAPDGTLIITVTRRKSTGWLYPSLVIGAVVAVAVLIFARRSREPEESGEEAEQFKPPGGVGEPGEEETGNAEPENSNEGAG